MEEQKKSNKHQKELKIIEILQQFENLKNDPVIVKGYINKIELIEREGKSSYLKCTIGDDTGELSATIWDENKAKELANELKSHSRNSSKIKVSVLIREWKNNIILNIEFYRLDLESNMIDLLQKSSKNIEYFKSSINTFIDLVKDSDLKLILQILFDSNYKDYPNEELRIKYTKIKNDFYNMPAATTHHHNYIHGLVEHSIGVTNAALHSSSYYSDIYEINQELLIVAGLTHDIGKVHEYTYKYGINRSENGNYLYHTVSGVIFINELLNDFSIKLDNKTKMELFHIITSHHGEYAEFTPNEFCIEAHLISQADLFDSQVNKALKQHSVGQLKRINRRL